MKHHEVAQARAGRGAAVPVAIVSVAFGVLATFLWQRVHAPDPAIAAGRADYERYCAECHGAGGRGDGPLASGLDPRPADLTRIAMRNGGTIDLVQFVDFIEGTSTSSAHVDRDMPVWGRILADVGEAPPGADRHELLRDRFARIVRYLATIQR